MCWELRIPSGPHGHTAASAENLQAAKVTAEVVIKALYAEVGWSLVVQWDSETSGK